MRNQILLIILLLVSFKSFSQKDTIVSLKQPIVKLVIKDLIQGDGFKKELSLISTKVFLLENKIVIKDSVIGNLDIKVINLESIITKKNEQFGLESEKSLELEKELKGEKRKTLLYKIGTYIGVGALLVLLGGR